MNEKFDELENKAVTAPTEAEENPAEENPNEEKSENEYTYTPAEGENPSIPQPVVIENTAAGIVGALLFSLAGGILYFIIYQLGFIAGIAGFIGVICAVKGYEIFAKKLSLKGVIIAVISSVVVILAAEYLSLAYSCLDMFRTEFDDPSITLADSAYFIRQMILDPELPDVRIEVIKEVGIALVLCAVASFTSIRNAIGSAKANKQ